MGLVFVFGWVLLAAWAKQVFILSLRRMGIVGMGMPTYGVKSLARRVLFAPLVASSSLMT